MSSANEEQTINLGTLMIKYHDSLNTISSGKEQLAKYINQIDAISSIFSDGNGNINMRAIVNDDTEPLPWNTVNGDTLSVKHARITISISKDTVGEFHRILQEIKDANDEKNRIDRRLKEMGYHSLIKNIN